MLHPKHCDHIQRLTEELAKRWGVRLYRYAIIVTGAKKGSALTSNETGRGFWDHLAFTRIVHFGRDFENMGRYLIKNLFESAGVSVKKLLAQGYRVCTISKDGLVSGAPS
ncbi:MAG: hypothetical protein AABZ06_05290 [Bdellovibrionota bacterium]